MIKQCKNCGSEYEAPNWRDSQFCARTCYTEYRRHRLTRPGQIHLGNDFWSLVDEEDAVALRDGAVWYMVKGQYPRKQSGRGDDLLNRHIMERILGRKLTLDELVDHKNGNNLDNRRHNLRLSDKSTNGINRHKPTHSKTGFRGVSLTKAKGRYKAWITFHGVSISIGTFSDLEESAWYRDQWAIALFEDYATLNFEYV